ncbi:MAG: AAA family ATPase [Bryobacteraceae bacterium]
MKLLTEDLADKLTRSGIKVTTPDGDTVRLQGVPLDPRLFSKQRTNILLRRSPKGSVLLAVDQDLDYFGPDPVLGRAFASGKRRQNWRIMVLPERLGESAGSVAAEALSLIGFGGAEGETVERRDSLLARFGTNFSGGGLEKTVDRKEQIARLVAAARAWHPRLAVIAGPSGVGKSNLLQAVAGTLRDSDPPLDMVSIDLPCLMAGAVLEASREELVARILEEAGQRSGTILAVENIDRAVLRAPSGHALLTAALDGGVRLIGTVLPENLPALLVAPLERRIEVVELEELSPTAVLEVLRLASQAIARHHGVGLREGVLEAAVTRSVVVNGALPARALTLLDAAAGRASVAGAKEVEMVHVYLAAADWQAPPSPAAETRGTPA